MRTIKLPTICDINFVSKSNLYKIREIEDNVIFDFAKVKEIDINVLLVLRNIKSFLEKKGYKVELINIDNIEKKNLNLLEEIIDINRVKKEEKIEKEYFQNIPLGFILRFFYNIGDFFFRAFQRLINYFFVIGYIFYQSIMAFFKKSDMLPKSYMFQMVKYGIDAIGVVVIMNFLIGFIIALQSAFQLRQYGAGIYLADMVGIAAFRELGPIITAIILVGRSGAAATAEIATMKVNEEFDGLLSNGIDPIEFVVVPKVWSFLLLSPILVIIGTAVIIFSGALVGLFYLDIKFSSFFTEMRTILGFFEIYFNLLKGFLFGLTIILVAAVEGINIKGGATEVGLATTRCVVRGILSIAFLDSLLSLIYFFV